MLFRIMADTVCHAPPKVSVTLQTEIRSTENFSFLKQIISLKSFNSVSSLSSMSTIAFYPRPMSPPPPPHTPQEALQTTSRWLKGSHFRLRSLSRCRHKKIDNLCELASYRLCFNKDRKVRIGIRYLLYVFIVRSDDHLTSIPDKKRKAYIIEDFFYLSEMYHIFQLFHLFSYEALLSVSLCQKIRLIRFRSESVISLEIKEGSKLNVTNVSI